MPVFYPKWHKNDYQNEPCYTGVVYTESNFSPRFIDLLFSAQNTKVKKVFVLITKITRLSLPSASTVSLSQCPLDAEDAGGLMCSPAASLESIWRSGPIYICHSMTRGKWIYNLECLCLSPLFSQQPSLHCGSRNWPGFSTADWDSAFRQFMIRSDEWHQACAEWREGRKTWGRSSKEPSRTVALFVRTLYSFCFAVSSLSRVLTTGSYLPGISFAAVIKTEIAVL